MRLFVEKLTNVDFSYLCPNRGLVGETWLANIELEGELDEQGMVCDFGVVKKQLRDWLDNTLDHCLLVPATNTKVAIQRQPYTTEIALSGPRALWTSAPFQAITTVEVNDITPETVARWCEQQLHGRFGNSVARIKLSFTTERIDGPFYHYSHGLKKHAGDCQRIAHGHRSAIKIWRNGKLCRQTMEQWALRWKDIYIGSREDLIEDKENAFHFRYQAQQGSFELKIPKRQCYIIDTDTTVELIAAHIHQELKHRSPEDVIKVKAFEGIGKGAIVTDES